MGFFLVLCNVINCIRDMLFVKIILVHNMKYIVMWCDIFTGSYWLQVIVIYVCSTCMHVCVACTLSAISLH